MAVRSLNKVTLIGNLTRDPELRYTPNGTAVATFTVATNREWTVESGEKREEAEFTRCVAWNKLAELCSQLLSKGRKVYVEGRLQTRSWQGQDGNQRTSTEVVISDMIVLDSRYKVQEEGTEVSPAPAPMQTQPPVKVKAKKQDDTKVEEKKNEPASPLSGAGEEEVNPDDIPF
ncbi:single-stranded DNA-binding protein [Candidatus Gottesmanbacteria bacterium]|nr:single-stranded DNA-binding protein [Candidatus Gottesmanbacteria bacterium]